ncbi:hypothetical protein T484DRAFT_1961889 [Baffinella frigidus]|nr:hypothetical protein T484DRAFT_1961889 [Cryptophyta sp. CCMP2293]
MVEPAAAATATSLAVIPRRKAKTAPMAAGRGGPIIITLDVLESFFHLPLPLASKRLGICRTALKKLCRKFGFSRWPRRSASVVEEGADADSDDQDQGARHASARQPNFADVLCGGGLSGGKAEEQSSGNSDTGHPGQVDSQPGGPKRSEGELGSAHRAKFSTGASPYGAYGGAPSYVVPHVPHATPEAYASTMAPGSFGQGFNSTAGGPSKDMLQQLQILQLLQLLQQSSAGKSAAPAVSSASPSALSLYGGLGGDMQTQVSRLGGFSALQDMASMQGGMMQQPFNHNFGAGDFGSSSASASMLSASSLAMPASFMPPGQGMPQHGQAQQAALQPPQPPQLPSGCNDVLEALKVGWLAGMQMAQQQSQPPSQPQPQPQQAMILPNQSQPMLLSQQSQLLSQLQGWPAPTQHEVSRPELEHLGVAGSLLALSDSTQLPR